MWIESANGEKPKWTWFADIEVIGPGHVSPQDNCIINDEQTKLFVIDPDCNIGIEVVPDNEDIKSVVSTGSVQLPANTSFVMLEAHAEYDTIRFVFE